MGGTFPLVLCLLSLILIVYGTSKTIESNDLCDNLDPELRKLVKCSSYRAKRRMETCDDNLCRNSDDDCGSCDMEVCDECRSYSYDCPSCCVSCQQPCYSNCQQSCNFNCQSNCRSSSQSCRKTSSSSTKVIPQKTTTPHTSQKTHNVHNVVNIYNRSSSYQNSFQVESKLNVNHHMNLPIVLNTVHHNTIQLNRTEPPHPPIVFPPCQTHPPGNITVVIKSNHSEGCQTLEPPPIPIQIIPTTTTTQRPWVPPQIVFVAPPPPPPPSPPVIHIPLPPSPPPPPPPPPKPICPLQQQSQVVMQQVPVQVQVPQVQVQVPQIQVPQVQVQVPQIQVPQVQVQQPSCIVNGFSTCNVQPNIVQTVPTSSYYISQQPSTACIVNGVNTCSQTQSYSSFIAPVKSTVQVQPTVGCILQPGQTTCDTGITNIQSMSSLSTSIPTTATVFQGQPCCIVTGERQCLPTSQSQYPLCYTPQRWVCGEQCKQQNPNQLKKNGRR